ncbi:mobilization protein [Sphingobium sp. AN558]|uniref:mobilization protein n=1 Tax=Sphingobium sp. AN558 TaxID=3133442 RepID=UPI0030C32071
MARTPVEERLEKMREDERKLRERRKALEARLTASRRKAETRERIMLGAFILHHIDQDTPTGRQLVPLLQRELPLFLTRERDHALMADLLKRLRDGPETGEAVNE